MCPSLSVVGSLSIALVAATTVLGQQRIEPKMQRPASIVSVEAELLLASAEPMKGKVSVQNMQEFGPGWSGGAQLFWGGTQIGAKLLLSFATTAAGRHEIFLHFTRAPDFGIVRAQVDDVGPVTFNGYAATVSRDRVLIGVRHLRAGTHQLRLEVTSKDGKSAGFNVGLDRIELQGLPDSTTSSLPRESVARAGDVEVGRTSIPLLPIPSSSTSRDDSPLQPAIEPLSVSARVELVQKTLSSTSTPFGKPRPPIRLTVENPKSGNSGIVLHEGVIDTRRSFRAIVLTGSSRLDLKYDPVEPQRPHLLECGGYVFDGGAQIRLSPWNQKGSPPVESNSQLAPGPARFLAVLIPAESHVELRLAAYPGTFSIHYCELTPF